MIRKGGEENPTGSEENPNSSEESPNSSEENPNSSEENPASTLFAHETQTLLLFLEKNFLVVPGFELMFFSSTA